MATVAPSTKPYLIRALHQWCSDCGFTPYIVVAMGEDVHVPMEYVKDDQIVLNISYDATSGLVIDSDYVMFKGRFGGVARDISFPVAFVTALYAKENGQGMGFPVEPYQRAATPAAPAADEAAPEKKPEVKRPSLTRIK